MSGFANLISAVQGFPGLVQQGMAREAAASQGPGSLVANPHIDAARQAPQGLGGVPLPGPNSGSQINGQPNNSLFTNPDYAIPAMNGTGGGGDASTPDWRKFNGMPNAPAVPEIHAPQMQDPKARAPVYGMNTGGWGFDGSQAGSQFQTSNNGGNAWTQSGAGQDTPWTKPGAWGQDDNGAAPGTYTRR